MERNLKLKGEKGGGVGEEGRGAGEEGLGLVINKSGDFFSLLIMCGSVWETSLSMLPLPT